MMPSCSNDFAQILLAGMQEVVGQDDLQTFFGSSTFTRERLIGQPDRRLSYEDLGAFQRALELSFGVTSGRGMLLRSGRAAFRHFLPAFWRHMGITNLQYRLNPTPVRIRVGLAALAKVLTESYGQPIEVLDEGPDWRWTMKTCPFCWERHTSGPVCDFVVGHLTGVSFVDNQRPFLCR